MIEIPGVQSGVQVARPVFKNRRILEIFLKNKVKDK
jgi:hypothetical protein